MAAAELLDHVRRQPSKGIEDGDWVINDSMLQREIVEVSVESPVPGGFYVYDDHIKNLFEIVLCGLGGYPWTVVHQNKRHGFSDEASWQSAVDDLDRLRSALRFE